MHKNPIQFSNLSITLFGCLYFGLTNFKMEATALLYDTQHCPVHCMDTHRSSLHGLKQSGSHIMSSYWMLNPYHFGVSNDLTLYSWQMGPISQWGIHAFQGILANSSFWYTQSIILLIFVLCLLSIWLYILSSVNGCQNIFQVYL